MEDAQQEPLGPRELARRRRLEAEFVPEHKRRKLAGKLTLALLLVLAVITGSLAGLTLVYSVDLPQIQRSGTLPPLDHDRSLRPQGPHHRLLCAGAARGGQLRRLCAGAAPGRDLD